MKTNHILTLLLALFLSAGGSAQVSSISYFMDRSVHSHELNPVLTPSEDYFDVLLGNTYLNMTMGVPLNKIFYPTPEGSMALGLNSRYQNEFLNALHKNNIIGADFSTSMFSLGLNRWGGYFTFGWNIRLTADASIPKAPFDFIANGFDTPMGGVVDLGQIRTQVTAYSEFAAGYSYDLSEFLPGLKVGGKVKFLVGHGNVDAHYTRLEASMTGNELKVSSYGIVRNASAAIIDFNALSTGSGSIISGVDPSMIVPGFGLGFDLGASYTLLDNALKVSLGVTDLGFIRWFEGAQTGIASGQPVATSDLINDKEFFNALTQSLIPLDQGSGNGYTSMLRAKLLVGAEYRLFDNRFSVGLLSKTNFLPTMVNEELMLSVNYRPARMIALAVSAAYNTFNYASLGFAVNFNPGPFNLFIATDYAPLAWAAPALPIAAKNVNLQFGISWNLRYNKKKSDATTPPSSYRNNANYLQ